MNKEDDAQVGVIVAILLAALFAIVLIIIQVEYVPNWMNDKEAEHMNLVQNQIALLKSNIDRQSTDRSITFPLTNPFKLGTERLPYFRSSRSYGTFDILSSDNNNFYIDITSPDATIEQKFYDEEFTTNQSITNITHITYFEILIQNVTPLNTEYFIISTVIEGEEKGNLTITVENGTITLTAIDLSGIIFNQPIAIGLTDPNYRINLIKPDYKLYKIIGTSIVNITSQIPFDINISLNGTASLYMTGEKFVSTSFPHNFPMGVMTYQSKSSYFPDYAFIYESGAIIVNQSGGHTMVFPPSLTIRNSTISFLFIDIEPLDEHDTISGFGTYAIKTIFTSSTNNRFRGTEINFTINTENPNAWYKYLNSTYNISTGYLNTTVSYSPNSATLKAEANVDKIEMIITYVKIFSQIEYA